jgi:PEGA domain
MALATLIFTPSVALGAPDRKTKNRVRMMVRDGQKAIRTGKLSEALRQFKGAYKLWNRKEIQFNIALVYLALKNDLAAAHHLRIYLRAAGPGAKTKLPSRFQQLLRGVAVLRVRVSRKDAGVFVDGKRVGVRRVEVVLRPGRHRVHIRFDGVVQMRTTVQLSPGQVLDWKPKLRRPFRPRRSRPRPGPTGTDPAVSGRSWQRLHWAYFVVATGLAAAAGGALIATGLKTNALEREFQLAPTPDLQKRGRAFLVATHALTGVTAAAVVTSALLAVFTRWRGRRVERPVTLIPVVSPRGASIVLRWTPTGH